MTAFQEKRVQTDFRYNVYSDESQKPKVLACPHCGHMSEHKANSLCFNCKRLIPAEAKNDWRYRNPFVRVSPLVVQGDQNKVCQFKRAKQTSCSLSSALYKSRHALVLACVIGSLSYSWPLLCKVCLTPAQQQSLNHQISLALSPSTYGLR